MENLCDWLDVNRKAHKAEMVAVWTLFIPDRGLLFGGDIFQTQLNSLVFRMTNPRADRLPLGHWADGETKSMSDDSALRKGRCRIMCLWIMVSPGFLRWLVSEAAKTEYILPIILQLHSSHCLSIPTVLSLIWLPSSLELGWHPVDADVSFSFPPV